jgi:hypothetical protein
MRPDHFQQGPRIQMRKTNPLHFFNSACNALPVHAKLPASDIPDAVDLKNTARRRLTIVHHAAVNAGFDFRR